MGVQHHIDGMVPNGGAEVGCYVVEQLDGSALACDCWSCLCLAQSSECNEDGEIYYACLVEECSDRFLDCLISGRGERCRCVLWIGVLYWCTVVGTAVSVRGVLRSGQRGCIESCKCMFDVPRHGYVNMSVVIILTYGESQVEGSSVVACCCVLCVDCIL